MKLQKELIYEGDWDILIILDACRYDIFTQLYGDVFNIKIVRSSGSCTMEWFVNTFDKPLKNTIYVSGNPFIGNYENEFDGKKYDPRKIFDIVDDVYLKAWRIKNHVYVIDPNIIRLRFIRWFLRYRNKKIIVHFMQPHAPYPFEPLLRSYFVNDMTNSDFKLWDALRKNQINRVLVLRGYIRTLKWVMTYVSDIIHFAYDKKVVITSDHGECFGENGIYGHPCHVDYPLLRNVVWAETY